MSTHILIIEDDQAQIDIYRKWLHDLLAPSCGVIVQFCCDGTEASSLLKDKSYDATVLDLALPGVNGLILESQFRNKMGHLIVATSMGHIALDMVPRANGFLLKPFDKVSFKRELKNMLGGDTYALERSDCTSKSIKII